MMERAEKRLDPGRRAELEASEASRELLRLYCDSQRDPSTSAAAAVRVLSLYREDRLAASRDHYHAAAILERSVAPGSKGNASRLLLVNELAAVAAIRGYPGALRLFAETWDRYARAAHRKPRYGTLPGSRVDPSVSPAVRRFFLLGPVEQR